MATIITFPRPRPDAKPARSFGARAVSMAVRIAWVLTVIAWPVLRWVLAFDVTIQLFRMLILFTDMGVYFDWTFAAHFMVVLGVFCFVACYRS